MHRPYLAVTSHYLSARALARYTVLRHADSVIARGEHEACRRAGELADLRYHWDEAYVITLAHGMFRAERRDDGAAISCVTAAGLRVLIRDDYTARRVPHT